MTKFISFLKFIYQKVIPLPIRDYLWEFYHNYEPPFLFLAVVGYRLSLRSLFKGFSRRKTILFYPEMPDYRYSVHKMCHLLGYKKTNNPHSKFDMMFRWEDTTIAAKNIEELVPKIPGLILNRRCTDISKRHVGQVFEKVFGYKLQVDPLSYIGQAIQKSDSNAKHDGKIILCPLKVVETGYVYQKLINNYFDRELTYDIRVPLFDGVIPCVYLKYRKKEYRFNRYFKSEIVWQPEEVLSREEIRNIIRFCEELGLDYGELDVLRDKDDGKVYIVDANNTPAILRFRTLSKRTYFKLLPHLANHFEKMVEGKGR